jgi:hypothetical protein
MYVSFLSPRVVARGGGQAPEKQNRQILPSRLSPTPAVCARSPTKLKAGGWCLELLRILTPEGRRTLYW